VDTNYGQRLLEKSDRSKRRLTSKKESTHEKRATKASKASKQRAEAAHDGFDPMGF